MCDSPGEDYDKSISSSSQLHMFVEGYLGNGNIPFINASIIIFLPL